MVTSRGGARGKGRAGGSSASEKIQQMAPFVQEPHPHLTTNQGVMVSDNHNSLKAGARGPTLGEDFILREKLGHFARERTAERVVSARGCAAHGVFQVYKALSEYTTARFLNDAESPTPVFVRFSNQCGERGSADTVRDVRGFAVKFYTSEGNYDLVGNNVPVFYLQDAIKFPDLMHAMKPEPHHGMPQASTAHDTFWDFVSLVPETSHMLMWAMSDRTLPRSYRMMQGHGVHTFRMVNSRGESHFVKLHWKPRQGVHTLLWDEAQQLAGRDPDFLRRDLWEAIEAGHFPEWELCLQLISPGLADSLGIDLLDATKLVPEELVPWTAVGRMTLNRNPDDFFAETEQVAFHPGHIVPGIDFTADPVLQGRLFSYSEAQASRLQGPNFDQLPINRSLCPVHNFQRGGAHRSSIARGPVAYEPHTLGAGAEFRVDGVAGGFQTQAQDVSAAKLRGRAEAFDDHFSQARLFWNSVGPVEREHIVEAFAHDLLQVRTLEVRQRALNNLAHVDERLARKVAQVIGAEMPDPKAAEGEAGFRKAPVSTADALAEAPSLAIAPPAALPEGKRHLVSRRVALMMADGVDVVALRPLQSALSDAGVTCVVVAPKLGSVITAGGRRVPADACFSTGSSSVEFDALVVCGGAESLKIMRSNELAAAWVAEAYRHGKPLVAIGEGRSFLQAIPALASAGVKPAVPVEGDKQARATSGVVFLSGNPETADAEVQSFVIALLAHRHHLRFTAS